MDGIVTQLALHHLPDFWKSRALKGMAGSLRPGGRLYLRDVVFPSEVDDYDAFFASVTDWMRSNAGGKMAEDTVRHIREEFSTLDWILEGMIERAGFDIVAKRCEGFLCVYVCEKNQE